jgi:YesN/AraC family two-component response regulator
MLNHPRDHDILSSITLLVVEDDTTARSSIERILSGKVKKLYTAKDGLVGLNIYKKHQPDIILSDINMPVMDGIEMSNAIHKINPEARIVLISAHVDSNHLMRAIEADVSRYLVKPTNINELESILAKIAQSIKKRKQMVSYQKYLKNIFNMQGNMVLISDGKKLLDANQHCYGFFGFESLQALKKKVNCVCDFFIDESGTITNQKGKSWIDEVLSAGLKKIKINALNGEPREFVIHIAPFIAYDSHTEYIVTLTDITDIV